MTGRSTQEMRGKIAVWQEAYGSVGQTQCLFNRKLELIQLLHDKQLIQFIVNLWQLALQLTHNDQGDQRMDAERKTLGVRRGICIE